jgi:hypothetical protein
LREKEREMTEQHGMSYPMTSVDWIQGINLDNLRDGRLARAKEQLFDISKFGAFLSLNEWNTRHPLHQQHLHASVDNAEFGSSIFPPV